MSTESLHSECVEIDINKRKSLRSEIFIKRAISVVNWKISPEDCDDSGTEFGARITIMIKAII